MRKMGINKNYVVGIYDDSKFSFHMSRGQKFKEITEFFTRFKYFGPIIVGNSVNEVLDKACEHNVDYCIVQSVGHIIKDAFFFASEKICRILFSASPTHLLSNSGPLIFKK